MLLTPIAIITGLLVGLARGGKLANLSALGLRWVPAIVIGLIMQSAADQWHMSGGIWLMIIGSFVLIAALGRNLHLKGMTILSIGMLLNLTAIALNGHIPTRFDSLVIAGVGNVDQTTAPESITRIRALGQIETSDTTLAFLGDIIPLPLISGVISFGDLIMLGGLFVLALNSVQVSRRGSSNLDEILGLSSPLDQARSRRLAAPLTGKEAASTALAGSEGLADSADSESIDDESTDSDPLKGGPIGSEPVADDPFGGGSLQRVNHPIVARRQTVIDLSEGSIDLTDPQSPDHSSSEDELLAPFPFPDSSTR